MLIYDSNIFAFFQDSSSCAQFLFFVIYKQKVPQHLHHLVRKKSLGSWVILKSCGMPHQVNPRLDKSVSALTVTWSFFWHSFVSAYSGQNVVFE